MALNPSWQLYSESKTLMQLKNTEKSKVADHSKDAESRGGFSKLQVGMAEAAEVKEMLANGGSGWLNPPPADHHPFGDIVWFS